MLTFGGAIHSGTPLTVILFVVGEEKSCHFCSFYWNHVRSMFGLWFSSLHKHV